MVPMGIIVDVFIVVQSAVHGPAIYRLKHRPIIVIGAREMR